MRAYLHVVRRLRVRHFTLSGRGQPVAVFGTLRTLVVRPSRLRVEAHRTWRAAAAVEPPERRVCLPTATFAPATGGTGEAATRRVARKSSPPAAEYRGADVA